uniref:Uncharacterized protein n=1 Tax=Magallana gigas TaxID=29159 RepID=K1PRS2_MAGGI
MCEKHDLTLDMTCEDCDEFICSQCAKTDHKDHDWKTISTAGNQRRRELKKTLGRVKEEDVKMMDEKIKKTSEQMEDNQKCCDSEVSKACLTQNTVGHTVPIRYTRLYTG